LKTTTFYFIAVQETALSVAEIFDPRNTVVQ